MTPIVGGFPGHRFENIDLLRGVAALLVVWLHAAEVFATLPGIAAHGTALHDFADTFGVGRIGVIAFFAISGYVIVPTVHGARASTTRAFLVKRFFRLFPAYWLSMALAIWTVWIAFGKDVTLPLVAANATMIPLEWGEAQLMGHYWTLEVELLFYVLVLALFWSGRLRSERTIAVCLLVLSIAWPVLYRTGWSKATVDRNKVWSFLSYFLTVMFWGAMVRARHAPEAPSKRWSLSDWPYGLVTLLVVGRPLLAVTFGSPTVNREDWRGTLFGLALFAAFVRMPRQWARPFVGLGTISYSLYLFHPAVFYPMFRWVRSHPAAATAPLWVYVASSLVASVVVAAIVYPVVEAPSNRLARSLVRRLDGR